MGTVPVPPDPVAALEDATTPEFGLEPSQAGTYRSVADNLVDDALPAGSRPWTKPPRRLTLAVSSPPRRFSGSFATPRPAVSQRRRRARHQPSVPQSIHDLPPVVRTTEENREYPDLERQRVNLEIKYKTLADHGANARSNVRMFGAPMRMRLERPHISQGLVTPSGRALDSTLKVVPEFPVGLNEMLLDEIKIMRDIRRAADPITPHASCACA